jgi:hypothetical protein
MTYLKGVMHMSNKIAIATKSSKLMRAVKRNAPGIALIGGGIGLCGAVVTSSIAAVKSVRMVDAEERKLGRKLTFKEKIKLCGKNYIPTMLLVCTSGASLAFSGKNYAKNLKEAGVLYAASEAARKSLEENVIKRFGQKKFNDIQYEADKQYLEEHPVIEEDIIIDIGGGNLIFEDTLSGRRFRGGTSTVEKGFLYANNKLIECDCLDYNEVWDCISPNFNPIGFGKRVGWKSRDPQTGRATPIKFYIDWVDIGREHPIGLIKYRNWPVTDFDRY